MPFARLLALSAVLFASLASARRAPTFDVKDLEGHRYTLSGLSGKIVVLNFWFKDCPACQREREELNRVVARYQGSSEVVFLAPALDKKSELRDFLRDNPLSYAVVADAEDLAETYAVSIYPTHVIIGRDGSIVRRWVGASDTFYRLTEALDAELKRPTSATGGSALPLPPGSAPVWEPALLVSPEHPTRGATVKLFYSPQSLQHPAEAQLGWDIHGDGSFTQGVAPMRPQGVLLSYELKLPEDATLIHLRVVSREDKRILEYTVPVAEADGQPVRNAFVNLGACDIPLPLERELARYPGSPFALLARLEEQLGPHGTSPEAAREEILGLLKHADGKALELLAVTADVLLRARDFQAFTQVLDTMEALEPGAFLTRRALSRLLTQPSAQAWRQWPAGLLPRAWKVLAARDDVWSRHAASQSTASVLDMEAAERICATWRVAESDNPLAHDCLARLLEKQGRLEEALAERRAAIEAVSTGNLLLYRPGGWKPAARDEEELWARHAELSLTVRAQLEP